ncbi:MAG: hypothetical protein NT138_26000 [Planctomycetales bacterium]|nr:hypothetical protein [Planctomycetales bacterium]
MTTPPKHGIPDRASAGRSNRAKLIGSIVFGGAIWVLGLLYLFSGRSNESSTPVPSWQQLLETAVTEIDGGANIRSDYQRALLIAAGRCDAAIELLQQHENGGLQKSDGINVVKQLVRFHREEKLQHPGLVSLLQPEDFARGRIQGLICRGDLGQADAELTAVLADNPHLLDIFFWEQMQIVKQRITNKQTEALANSLRLAVERTTVEYGRRLNMNEWLRQMEQCSDLVAQHHLTELIPQLLTNADAASEDLKSDTAGSLVMARNHSLLAAIFFYCKKPDRANEQLAIAADHVERTSEELRTGETVDSSSSRIWVNNAQDLLHVTGRIAALLASSGRIEDSRKQIESTKAQLRDIHGDTDLNADNIIIRELLNYGAFDLAEESISTMPPTHSRLSWQVHFCQELARHNRREDAITRLQTKVIPELSLETERIKRLIIQCDLIELLNTLGEKQLCSNVVQEVLAEYEDHHSPKDLQLVFELMVRIHDYENAWKLFRECDLAASDAMNLAKLGISLHDHQLASSGKK